MMYTSYTHVLPYGNNCFPAKMLQQDSLFTFQGRLKLDLVLSGPEQFYSKAHKMNGSFVAQFHSLTDIPAMEIIDSMTLET